MSDALDATKRAILNQLTAAAKSLTMKEYRELLDWLSEEATDRFNAT